MKEFKRKRCICFVVVTFITCLVLAACITSALLIHVIGAFQSKLTVTATNQKYSEGMEDSSSQVFQDFQDQFCSAKWFDRRNFLHIYQNREVGSGSPNTNYGKPSC
ncbi:hypothetical protein LOTGIDRAFT_167238 [Lottia gigantea]|uniref:SEA domain-containing protein n=1 Tax=Lottia gigantea TaxID=225164 RepID=V4BDD7_LOTGI|nr:hypothetical protein LOTGIDRAFT_167238 [Lottia gigantea]ESO86424.1 hypothetical protein LOTGIDRAFT_167238 [Lottia gigantea]